MAFHYGNQLGPRRHHRHIQPSIEREDLEVIMMRGIRCRRPGAEVANGTAVMETLPCIVGLKQPGHLWYPLLQFRYISRNIIYLPMHPAVLCPITDPAVAKYCPR